jgi:hypothetical protein
LEIVSPMKSRRASFAKQARIRMRSTVKLVLFLSGAASASFIAWGYGWQVRLCLGLAGFFTFISLVELLAALYNERAE